MEIEGKPQEPKQRPGPGNEEAKSSQRFAGGSILVLLIAFCGLIAGIYIYIAHHLILYDFTCSTGIPDDSYDTQFTPQNSLPISSGDTSYMIFSSVLVMLMTPGLAFFYGGLPSNRVIFRM